MKQSDPYIKHLVLVGGGHSHVQVVKQFGMTPVPGLKVTLICKDTDTPYSGMLPGHVAGHYSFDDIHIDLMRLSAWAGIRYINAAVVAMDPDIKRLELDDASHMSFDLVSINTGSSPDLDTVPGARDFALPVKPIASFLQRWDSSEQKIGQQSSNRIAVVGAGAGGVELLLALQHRLRDQQASGQVAFSLIGRADRVLPSQSLGLSRRLERELRAKGIDLHFGQGVTQVEQNTLTLDDGQKLAHDALLWVTKAKAGSWLRNTGLELTQQGFIAVEDTLQTCSHPHIFAAGDCATMIHQPREKAGVFAVRQGPILARNLIAFAKGQPLKAHKAQSSYLSLVALGHKSAAGAKAWVNFAGPWVWRWKDSIDRAFMTKFSDLPPMAVETNKEGLQPPANSEADLAKPLCSGCGGKVAQSSLSAALSATGLTSGPEDASLIPGTDLVQSIDLLTLPLSDFKASAAIITAHALSDIYAEGGSPLGAQVLIGVQRQMAQLEQDDMSRLMQGVMQVLDHDGVEILGGHSLITAEPMAGLAVTGRLNSEKRWTKSGAKIGDLLYITKPLGSGALLAGLMDGNTKGRWIDAALPSLLTTNKAHADILRNFAPSAVTDITGFGLLGHGLEIASASGVTLSLDAQTLPLFDGVTEVLLKGTRASLHAENARGFALNPEDPKQLVLADPQSSGGLLIALNPDQAPAFEQACRQADLPLWSIGSCQAPGASGPTLIF